MSQSDTTDFTERNQRTALLIKKYMYIICTLNLLTGTERI